jgi:hypothetical protein
VAWDSKTGGKGDPSAKTAIFTLKNPHNFPPTKFALKADRTKTAIYCSALLLGWD